MAASSSSALPAFMRWRDNLQRRTRELLRVAQVMHDRLRAMRDLQATPAQLREAQNDQETWRQAIDAMLATGEDMALLEKDAEQRHFALVSAGKAHGSLASSLYDPMPAKPAAPARPRAFGGPGSGGAGGKRGKKKTAAKPASASARKRRRED